MDLDSLQAFGMSKYVVLHQVVIASALRIHPGENGPVWSYYNPLPSADEASIRISLSAHN